MSYTRGKRTYCEDLSPTLLDIKKSKHHGSSINIDGILYERIGDDMLYNNKTSLIKKLWKNNYQQNGVLKY